MTPNFDALVRYAAANPGLADAALAAAYNAATASVARPLVPVAEVLIWAGTGPLDAIETASTGFTSADASVQKQIRAACKASLRLFYGGTETFDTGNATNQALLDALVAANALSAADKAGLMALATVTAPLYAQPGEFGYPAAADDFKAARS
jgi:hypothetical protein